MRPMFSTLDQAGINQVCGMFWIFVVVGVLLVLGALNKASETAKKVDENRAFDQALQTRTEAEIDRIKRTSSGGPLAELTDNELRDLIARSARDLKQASDAGNGIGAFILLAGIAFGVFAALSAKEWGPLVVFGLAGLGVGYAVSQRFIKKAKAEIAKRGLDPDRIEIN
ncbi:hypothetical protein [Tabrizicola sp. M-4]|uniref:hypothetical protein n=1 Tax=Tabrizicola sp. M-4 TaxID=3055847 RepID=UPI003DA870A7